jgi:hypothetical protein
VVHGGDDGFGVGDPGVELQNSEETGGDGDAGGEDGEG